MRERILALRGDIELSTVGKIMDEIIAVNEEEDKEEPIHLYIQSDGGVAMDAYSLVDIMLTSEVPIYTYCNSYVSSSALDIYLCGQKRFVYPHSRFLIHGVKSSFDNATLPNIKSNLDNIETIEQFGKDMLIAKTNFTHNQITKLYSENRDIWIGYEDALNYGIATDFISYKIN